MTNKQAQKRALKNYEGLIRCLETFPKRAKIHSESDMLMELWSVFIYPCSYCKKYKHYCVECVLKVDGGCCGGLFESMTSAETYGQALKYAKAIHKFIQEKGI